MLINSQILRSALRVIKPQSIIRLTSTNIIENSNVKSTNPSAVPKFNFVSNSNQKSTSK